MEFSSKPFVRNQFPTRTSNAFIAESVCASKVKSSAKARLLILGTETSEDSSTKSQFSPKSTSNVSKKRLKSNGARTEPCGTPRSTEIAGGNSDRDKPKETQGKRR